MNKEKYNQIIDEVYENYCNTYPNVEKKFKYEGSDIEVRKMTQEEFIDYIKTDNEFAERWGLKIKERKLSLEERVEYFNSKMINEGIRTQIATVDVDKSYWKKSLEETNHNIPTKLITISYNNEKTEIYE
jgi:hypothetical protein